jgi:hypothetical protein
MGTRKAIGLGVLVVILVGTTLSGLLSPALARAKARARRAASINNIKQVGLSFRHTRNDLRAPFLIPAAFAAPTIRAADQERGLTPRPLP